MRNWFVCFVSNIVLLYNYTEAATYRRVDYYPSSRNCPVVDMKKINNTTNLVELLSYIKGSHYPTSVYAAHHLYKIPLKTLTSQSGELAQIQAWKSVENKKHPDLGLNPITVLSGKIKNISKTPFVSKIEAIESWEELFQKSLTMPFYGSEFYYFDFIKLKASQLPITPQDVQFFEQVINGTCTLFDEKQHILSYRILQRLAIQFLAQAQPTEDTMTLIKNYVLMLRNRELTVIKSPMKTWYYDTILVFLYDINTPAADQALLDILKEFINKGHFSPNNLSYLDLKDPVYVNVLALLVDLLRDAQIQGVTPYLRTLSKDESIHLWIRKAAEESADWREKNSKYQ